MIVKMCFQNLPGLHSAGSKSINQKGNVKKWTPNNDKSMYYYSQKVTMNFYFAPQYFFLSFFSIAALLFLIPLVAASSDLFHSYRFTSTCFASAFPVL